MPNWCSNDLYIEGSKADLNEFMVLFEEEGLKFERYFPVPDEVDDVKAWKRSNWGCERSPDDESVNITVFDESVNITFDTAWRPANEFIKRISKFHPHLRFQLIWDEPGNGLHGDEIYQDGIQVSDVEEREMTETMRKARPWSPRDYEVDHLREAIQGMKDTCQRALQNLNEGERGGRPVEEMASIVMHDLVWGLANSTSSIETAFRSDSRERE